MSAVGGTAGGATWVSPAPSREPSLATQLLAIYVDAATPGTHITPLIATPVVASSQRPNTGGCSCCSTVRTVVGGVLLVLALTSGSTWLVTALIAGRAIPDNAPFVCEGTCSPVPGKCHPHHYLDDHDSSASRWFPPDACANSDSTPAEQAQCVGGGGGVWVSDEPGCTEPFVQLTCVRDNVNGRIFNDASTCDAGRCMCSGGTVDDPDNSWQNREWWVLFSVLFPILLFWVCCMVCCMYSVAFDPNGSLYTWHMARKRRKEVAVLGGGLQQEVVMTV